MNWAALRGKFIVIDGPDGAGKSTQVKLLSEVMTTNGIEATVVYDPGGTKIGDQVRAILLDNRNAEMSVRCEMLLYMASRAQLYAERIGPALEAGHCVLSDRWVSSTYAYQAVAGKLGCDEMLRVAEAALERTWPDLTVIIDLPSEVGLSRVGATRDRMEDRGESFHRRVREAFLSLAQSGQGGPSLVVSGEGGVQEVHERLLSALAGHAW